MALTWQNTHAGDTNKWQSTEVNRSGQYRIHKQFGHIVISTPSFHTIRLMDSILICRLLVLFLLLVPCAGSGHSWHQNSFFSPLILSRIDTISFHFFFFSRDWANKLKWRITSQSYHDTTAIIILHLLNTNARVHECLAFKRILNDDNND